MVGSFLRLAAAAVFCAALAGCASSPDRDYSDSDVSVPDSPLQCVPYARDHAHIALYGDAYTWWNKAAGRFSRSSAPSEGSVMVLHDYAGPDRAHLAVVNRVVDSREIRVDHANWLDDGAIYVNDPVRDVSPGNDWSEVRVYNIKAAAWGARVYPVQGFIGPGPEDADTVRIAQNPHPAVSQAGGQDSAQDGAPDSDTDGLVADDPEPEGVNR